MTDPERWLGSADAPEGMSAMLEAAKSTAPTAAQKAALATSLAGGAGAAAATASSFGAVQAVLVGTALLGGAWAASSVAGEERVPEPAPTVAEPSASSEPSAPKKPTVPTTVPPTETKPQPVVTPLAVTSAEKSKAEDGAFDEPVAAPAKPSSKKPSEASLIRQANASLEKSPAWALSLLKRHESLYPTGVLAEERDVLKLRALKKLGKSKAAAAEQKQFQKEHPGSVHHLE